MKRILLAIIAYVWAVCVVQAGGPEARFLAEEYDFGAFDENDGTVSCRFAYVNAGDEPLVIVASRATCGCTSSSYTKSPVEPGDTGYVEVTYNPTGRPGRFGKKVYVDFNSEHPRTTLLIKGVVIGASNTLRGRYPVDAGAVKLRSDNILFGEIKHGKSKTSFFELYNATPDSITPRWVHIPRGVKIDTPTPTVGPGEQASYTLFFVPEKDMYGIYTDSLMLQATEMDEPVKIDMIAIVDEDFSKLTPGQLRDAPLIDVESSVVDFGELRLDGGPVTRSFVIRNGGQSTMMLRRVYSTDPGITVTTTTDKLKKGKETTIQVTVDPRAIPSEILNGRIMIIVNDPHNPNNIVRAVGTIVP